MYYSQIRLDALPAESAGELLKALLDAGEERPHLGGRDDPAAHGGVARMVAEAHRVEGPDLEAEPLQQEDRGAVAHMAIDDRGLDREDAHGCGPPTRPPTCSAACPIEIVVMEVE